ncbi:MAG: ceramidase domain-containing protein [Gammaproteobacteria bacterium]
MDSRLAAATPDARAGRQGEVHWLVLAVAVAALAALAVLVFALVPAIPQDPAYHGFADDRAWLGVPNFANVASNIPMLLLGASGVFSLSRVSPGLPMPACIAFSVAVILVGTGSGYYHYAPTRDTLVWDRLPMTVAFMTLFAIVIHDRLSVRLARWLLWPLVLAGVGSVLYWDWTELEGRGDLRLYGLVQFVPLLLVPAMLLTRPRGMLHTGWLWAMIGLYGAAKLAEQADAPILAVTGILSGHSLKHLLAAGAIYCALRAMHRRLRLP